MNRRTLLATALAAGLAPAVRARAQSPSLVPVLTYHRFDPVQAKSSTIVTTPVFAAQMRELAANNTHVVPLRDVLAFATGTPIAAPTVAITFDDGWRSVHAEAWPILRDHKTPITLFLNPPMIGQGGAYLTWAMVEEMVKSGHVDIQPHTQSHPNFNTERARRDPAAFQAFVDQEIAGSRALLKQRLGVAADMLAWPFGIHDTMLEEAAKRAGCIAAWALGSRAVAQGDPAFALPRYQVYETDRDPRFAWILQGHPRKTLHAKAAT